MSLAINLVCLVSVVFLLMGAVFEGTSVFLVAIPISICVLIIMSNTRKE
jgi:hypothetical protein